MTSEAFVYRRAGSRVTEAAGEGGGVHPAIVRAHSLALALSVMPGNRRRSSMAAESSPCSLKMARIAAASASVTMNISAGWEGTSRRASQSFANLIPGPHATGSVRRKTVAAVRQRNRVLSYAHMTDNEVWGSCAGRSGRG